MSFTLHPDRDAIGRKAVREICGAVEWLCAAVDFELSVVEAGYASRQHHNTDLTRTSVTRVFSLRLFIQSIRSSAVELFQSIAKGRALIFHC